MLFMLTAGKMDPYIKRCCATKIQSAEKLMYICKNQLGKSLCIMFDSSQSQLKVEINYIISLKHNK